jgi:hydroxyacyl-ACP dehydratase HTD2-like protein with hotdog domain
VTEAAHTSLELRDGQVLPAAEVLVTTVQLFRFSAVTWNAHRIHYDESYAQFEGYPSVLVQSHLHGCFLLRTAMDWAGPSARLRRFRWENRHSAVAGERLTCTGRIEKLAREHETAIVDVALEERNAAGVLCAPGWAVVEIPMRSAVGGVE